MIVYLNIYTSSRISPSTLFSYLMIADSHDLPFRSSRNGSPTTILKLDTVRTIGVVNDFLNDTNVS
jgi:hypothetical protein